MLCLAGVTRWRHFELDHSPPPSHNAPQKFA
jgi:hypothetical protein